MIRSTAKALLLKDGKLLLNRCHKDSGAVYYDLPGGGQHDFEPLEEAVAREVLEETGYQVQVDGFAALCEEIWTDPSLIEKFPEYSHRMLHIFKAHVVSEVQENPSELDYRQEGFVWVSPEEADTLPLLPKSLEGKVSRVLAGAAPVWLGTTYENDF